MGIGFVYCLDLATNIPSNGSSLTFLERLFPMTHYCEAFPDTQPPCSPLPLAFVYLLCTDPNSLISHCFCSSSPSLRGRFIGRAQGRLPSIPQPVRISSGHSLFQVMGTRQPSPPHHCSCIQPCFQLYSLLGHESRRCYPSGNTS